MASSRAKAELARLSQSMANQVRQRRALHGATMRRRRKALRLRGAEAKTIYPMSTGMRASMNSRHDGGCIYCGSPGPFSDEHVVSAGLGGDDSAWLLKGCVCEICNTGIFSKLETKFLRASPVALARLFLQPQTRGRSSKKSMPSVQPHVSFHPDPASGVLLEADLGPGGAGQILPQLVFVDAQRVGMSAQDGPSMSAFLSTLKQSMPDEVTLIEKAREGFEVAYRLTTLGWADGAYSVRETATQSRPPKTGFWVEPLVRPATARDGELLPPRIFQRLAGQLVCRADSTEQAARMLAVLRNVPEVWDSSSVSPPPLTEDQTGYHQRYAIDMAVYDRVFTKIGLNLVAKLLGLDLVRNDAFDSAMAHAREGIGGIYKLPREASGQFAKLFGPALADKHVLALLSKTDRNGGASLIFLARLYGGPMEIIRLAEFDEPIPGLEQTIVVHVDYVDQVIKRQSLEEHLLAVVLEHGERWNAEAACEIINRSDT